MTELVASLDSRLELTDDRADPPSIDLTFAGTLRSQQLAVSDDWIRIVPAEPEHIPDPEHEAAVIRLVHELLPGAEDVSVGRSDESTPRCRRQPGHGNMPPLRHLAW